MSLLHSFLLFQLSPLIFFSLQSLFKQSLQLLLGRPLLPLFTSISIASGPMWSPPLLLLKWPHHISLDSCIFLVTSTTLTVHLINSFMILSHLVSGHSNHPSERIHFDDHPLLFGLLQRCRFQFVHQCWSHNCLVRFTFQSDG